MSAPTLPSSGKLYFTVVQILFISVDFITKTCSSITDGRQHRPHSLTAYVVGEIEFDKQDHVQLRRTEYNSDSSYLSDMIHHTQHYQGTQLLSIAWPQASHRHTQEERAPKGGDERSGVPFLQEIIQRHQQLYQAHEERASPGAQAQVRWLRHRVH